MQVASTTAPRRASSSTCSVRRGFLRLMWVGMNMSGRGAVFPDDFENQVEAGGLDPGVDGDEARLVGHQGCHADGRGQRRQVGRLEVGSADVGEGQLAADDRLEIDQVAGDAAGDGRGRVPVGAREHEGRDALGVEGLGLGVEALDGAGEGVGAEQPHGRGHAVCRVHAELHLRGAGVEPALAAAAGEMLVPVDEARHHGEPPGVDDLDLAGQPPGIDAFFDGQDLAAAGQDVAAAHGAGPKNLSVPYQYHACKPPQILPKWSACR